MPSRSPLPGNDETDVAARARALLDGGNDLRSILDSLARLAVGTIADYCFIDGVDDGGTIHRLSGAHADPELQPLIDEIRGFGPSAGNPARQVIGTGKTRILHPITETMYLAASSNERHLEILRRLAPTSIVVVPMSAGGRVVGSIAFAATTSGRVYSEADLPVFEAIARSAARSVETAVLLEHEKSIHERLRESEALFRGAQETSLDGYIFLRILRTARGAVKDFEMIYQNVSASKMNGLDPATISGKRLFETFPTLLHTPLAAFYLEVAERGAPARIEEPFNADGVSGFFQIMAVRIGTEYVGITFSDISDRKNAEAERAELLERERIARARAEVERSHLHTLFQEAPASIAILRGPELVYEFANPRYLALVGKERSILGKPGRAAFPEFVAQGVWDMLDSVYATGAPVFEREFPARLDRGGTLSDGYFSFVVQPFRDEHGVIAGIMVFAFETTDQVLARKRSEALTADLQREKEAKDRFLAVLSHEIRNPLASVRTALEVMRVKAGDASAVERTRQVVERQVQHLSRMTDDLLDISRTISGKIQLRRENLELGALVAAVVEDQRGQFEKQRITIDVVPFPGRVPVYGDATRLSQVVANLLQNAGKFTDPGGRVVVTLDVRERRARISVRDTGIGIEPELLRELFEPFIQGDRSLDRSRGGLGLGLALVKRLAELHGGAAWAASEGAGRGAEFVVEIPVGERQDTRAFHPPALDPTSAGARKRVLVIDDLADIADTLAELLAAQGHEVEAAYSSADGLTAARRFRPDVVLCDIGLPGIDGFEVARRLRGDEATTRATLIAISGYGQAEDRRRALDAGFDQHLTKPVAPEHLLRILGAFAP